jgi:hypothetical protein
VVRILASGGHHYAGLRWLEHGDGLAFLEGRHDEAWKQDLYTLWGFSGFGAGDPVEVHWDPATEPSFPTRDGNPSHSPSLLARGPLGHRVRAAQARRRARSRAKAKEAANDAADASGTEQTASVADQDEKKNDKKDTKKDKPETRAW